MNIIDDMQSRVEKAITENENFSKNWNVNIIAENGVITLQGAVPSHEHADLAEKIAEQQQGVKSVINQLDIDETLEDEELKIKRQDYVPPTRQH